MEQPVLPEVVEEDVVTITDETTGALTPEGNLTLVDDYYTNYSDGSGQQFITLVSKSGATFYLVIDRNSKGAQTVHFMNLVDEADLLTLMEEEDAEVYTAEKEAAAKAEQDRLKAEEEAKKAAEEAAASGTEQPKENKVTKIASGFLGVVVLIALAAGGGFYFYRQQEQKQKRQKKKPLTPMQITPRTRAISISPPMCRTRTKPRTSRTLNPSDFKAAFAAVHNYDSNRPDWNDIVVSIYDADFWLHADDSTFPAWDRGFVQQREHLRQFGAGIRGLF